MATAMSVKSRDALASSDRGNGRGRKLSWPTSSRHQSASPHRRGDNGPGRRRSSSLSDATVESRQSTTWYGAPVVSIHDETDGVDSYSNTLTKRLKELSLSKETVNRNAKDVNELCDLILERLKDKGSTERKRLYPFSFRWERMRSGSYYERVKIDEPDEYDCMFTCDIRAEAVYDDIPSPCYCALRVVDSKYALSADMICTSIASSGGQGCVNVCPKKFRKQFRDNMKEIVKDPTLITKFKITVKRDNHRCPAVTLNVQIVGTDRHFDIDIVPAIRLVEWPKTARHEMLRRIGITSIQEIIDRKLLPCVVPKIQEDERSADAVNCRLWRLSFSALEKQLILHADGTRSTSRQPTCRKDVLRLLKADLAAHGKPENHVISSYHLKTVVLHLLDEMENDSDWSAEKLRECYTRALRKVVDCLESGCIRHYFVDANLIEFKQDKDGDKEDKEDKEYRDGDKDDKVERDKDREKLSALANYFKRLLK